MNGDGNPCLQILLEEGAKKRKEDEDGDTPFDLICGAELSKCDDEDETKLIELLS